MVDHNRPPPLHLSLRRELQLQPRRPSPLRLSKNSHTITKPPPQKPVIIHTISPKVIHVEPANFMGLVQRLTGPTTAAPHRPMASSAANADVPGQPERPSSVPRVLSPAPLSSAFFSPSTVDPTSTSIGLSPGATAWDIFNQFQDF